MPILDGKEQEQQGVMEAARLMVISARTAPKSGGVDDIYTAIVCGDEVEDLAMDKVPSPLLTLDKRKIGCKAYAALENISNQTSGSCCLGLNC